MQAAVRNEPRSGLLARFSEGAYEMVTAGVECEARVNGVAANITASKVKGACSAAYKVGEVPLLRDAASVLRALYCGEGVRCCGCGAGQQRIARTPPPCPSCSPYTAQRRCPGRSAMTSWGRPFYLQERGTGDTPGWTVEACVES
eukprot:6172329-Pleurochrysis_carterae.AAC.2